ncbi:MAG: C/D box methylation guide ribonucleoprotein complex aNOP56 subunit, partial [Candidatus Lokiarchaeota archaeon]|nr:C/D box methylation guide ribonucleoprotein complex aNOP56 subunit [Candidatus Lokiarchaeota archaeon]
LIGSQLAGKIITMAGGLRDLALMPSSTIQVLGAEKALFRSLRKNADSPKHGIIYTWPEIRGAQYWQRGKISRLLAGKISICSKVDYFKGDYIGDTILKEVKEKIEQIKESFPKPPKKKKRSRKSRRRKKGRRK